MGETKPTLNGDGKQEKMDISGDDVQGPPDKKKGLTHALDQNQSDLSQEPDGSHRVPRAPNIDLLFDIPVHVSVEVGRVKMMIRDLLDLGHGSIITLNTLAEKPMEVLIYDKLIARGEAVQKNGRLGIRIVEIVTPKERIERLR